MTPEFFDAIRKLSTGDRLTLLNMIGRGLPKLFAVPALASEFRETERSLKCRLAQAA